MPVRYDQDTKAKAIRLVREHAGDYPSEYAAITAVARRLGMVPETLRKWIRQAAVDEGQAPGVSSEAAREIREPGQLHVADFTYVPLDGGGFGYTALVVDAFAGLIPGWECSLSKETAFVERAIRQAAALRARQGHPLGDGAVHHSDAGSQYTSVRFAETLLLEGLTPLVGTVGDALDNALAETTVGLYKTECTRQGSPFRAGPVRTLADLEEITSAWVHWYNTSRLMHRLGRRPPAEAEAGRSGQAATQASSRCACAAEARTRTWPSGTSSAPSATAVCDPLCGSTPIITTATTCPFPHIHARRETAAGMPYYGSVIIAPVTSHATARSGRPARRSKARPQTGRQRI